MYPLKCIYVLWWVRILVWKNPFCGSRIRCYQLIASSHVTPWLSCIVGNVGSMLWKGWRTIKGDVSGFDGLLNQSTAFQNLATTLPTMQFSHWGNSLEAIYQIKCIFLWSNQKALYCFPTYAVLFNNTWKHIQDNYTGLKGR